MNPLPYAALLLAFALPVSPAAAAESGPTSCWIDGIALTSGEAGEPDTYSALVHLYSVVTSSSGEPVSADVSCSIWVEGVLNTVVTASGTTLVVGVAPTEFTADPLAEVDICMTVDYTSDGTPTEDWCYEHTQMEFPASETWTFPYSVVASLPGGAEAVCAAALAAEPLVPDVWGTFGIGADGTIAVGGSTNGWAACRDGSTDD